MADPNILHPKSLDEIQQAFEPKPGKPASTAPIRFTRSGSSPKRLLLHATPAPGLRLQCRQQRLTCEFSGNAIQLDLEAFDVKSEIVEGEILCEFSLREPLSGTLKEKLNAVENTKYPIFVTRALNALASLEEAMPAESIEAASAAPTDYQVLVEALQTPMVTQELIELDPLATAKLRGFVRKHQLVNEFGGAIGGEEVAALLGITRQGVDKRRRENRLIGLTQGRRGYVYPTWQFERGGTLNHLETVLDALRNHDPWMQLSFFVNPHDRLAGFSPLDTLREGKLEPVLQAAATFGEQGLL